MANQLSSLVTAELAGPADPRAAAMAGALAARYPSAARAVLRSKPALTKMPCPP